MNVIQEFTEWQRTQRFSLREAAQKINVDHGTLGQIVRGERKCPPKVMVKIMKVTISTRSENGRPSGS